MKKANKEVEKKAAAGGTPTALQANDWITQLRKAKTGKDPALSQVTETKKK